MANNSVFKPHSWHSTPSHKSLEEVYKSIQIQEKASFFKKLLSFTGPGYLVAVGYMDPGNWATDIAGGSKFSYSLLSVILISNCMAVVLQYLALKLGIVTGKDLAQACQEHYSQATSFFLWILAEIAIIACDLAEIIGSALALNLLFSIPLFWGVLLTAFDVFLLLLLQQRSFRYLESIVIILIVTILTCFAINIFLSAPQFTQLIKGFIPSKELITNPEMLYIAIGILGATVMPHNLYLHSSVVQTRAYGESPSAKKEAIFFSALDSTIALSLAFLVNAGILIVAAAVFYSRGLHEVAEIQDAYQLLTPLLGSQIASIVFACALLAAGQNATITGTLAGQIIMEGFTSFSLPPWARRFLSRSLAIIPAIVVVWHYGQNGLSNLLLLSQVILSLQLPFAVFPLVQFTSHQGNMGIFVNSLSLKIIGYFLAFSIVLLNSWLLIKIAF